MNSSVFLAVLASKMCFLTSFLLANVFEFSAYFYKIASLSQNPLVQLLISLNFSISFSASNNYSLIESS